jgi:ketosteroid isomerase-like protein
VSANLDLVRSMFGAWERGEFGSLAWAHPSIEYSVIGGPDPVDSTDLAGMVAWWSDQLHLWEGQHIEAEDYVEIDEDRVLVLTHPQGADSFSGVSVDELGGSAGAHLVHVREGLVWQLVVYWDREDALAALGLERY